MNQTRLLTIGVVLLLLLNAATLVYLYNGQGRPEGPPGRPDAFIIEQLQLDKEQQAAFARLRGQHQEAIREAREKDRDLHDAYFNLLKTDHPDMTKVDSLTALIGAQRQVIESATFNHFLQLRALCRPDQQKLFDNTIDDIARRMAPPPHR